MKKQNATRVFAVEDDPMYMKLVKYVLELNQDYEVHTFENGMDCIKNLHLNPSIITLDYTLPDVSGQEVLKRIKSYNSDIQVIILSGQQDIQTAVQLLKDGAYDYITKDNETREKLLNTLNHMSQNLNLKKEVEELKEELVDKYAFENSIVGDSPAMHKIFRLLNKAVKSNISVSITGETGTGKEVVAKAIHYNSNQKKGKFVAVNVSAIPSELLESELFGHEKGAFTGANARKLGYFEVANEGTLFLDEIAEMDISLQAKLLRALQEREVTRVGGTTPIKFDARVIVATHKNLSEEVNRGNFREDLYYRLLGLPIPLPPLRERNNDVMLLTNFFLNDYIKKNKVEKISIDKSGKNKLMKYSFPGNVRELKAIIELAAVMAEDDVITADDISFNSPRQTSVLLNDEMCLKDYNRKIVYHFLEKYNNNVLLVAKKLDIGKSTIYRMLKEDKEPDGTDSSVFNFE